MSEDRLVLLDAGLFIGALLIGDSRHQEARKIVDAARKGEFSACTTTSILSEVYAALTWVNAQPPHEPGEAANAVRLLVEPPSAIEVLKDGVEASLKMLEISEEFKLSARRVHDARHAATAIVNDVTSVYTYDLNDWKIFKPTGLIITGPPSILEKINE